MPTYARYCIQVPICRLHQPPKPTFLWQFGSGDATLAIAYNASIYHRFNDQTHALLLLGLKLRGITPTLLWQPPKPKAPSCDEALLCDMNGNIAEGSGANLKTENDNTLYTPPQGNILLQVLPAATVIGKAQQLGINVVEKLFGFDELKTSNSRLSFVLFPAAEVAGIKSVNDYIFPSNWQDTKGYLIQQTYKQLTTGNFFGSSGY